MTAPAPGQVDRAVIRCPRRITIAGLAGGLAMIPVGLVLRFMFGQSLNVYGELVVTRIAGRLDPFILAAEHAAVSVALAAPLVVTLDRLGHRAAPVVGLIYGGSAWLAVNSLVLPWIFDQPTPWQIGSRVIWGSLIVHLVFGLVVAIVSRRLALFEPYALGSVSEGPRRGVRADRKQAPDGPREPDVQRLDEPLDRPLRRRDDRPAGHGVARRTQRGA